MKETITSTEAPYPVGDSLYIDIIRELSAIRAAANIINSEFATKKNVIYNEMFDSQACRINDIYCHTVYWKQT